MKLKKPSSKSALSSAVMVGSAATGAMLSKGVVGLLPNGKPLTTSAIAAIVTGLLAASVGGGKGSEVVKGLLIGMSIEQTTEVIKEIAKTNVNTSSISNTTLKQFIDDSLGLSGANGLKALRANNVDYSNLWDRAIQPKAQQNASPNMVA